MSSVLTSPATRTASGFTASQFESFLRTVNEPAWFTARRRAAFEIYEQKLKEPLYPEEYKRVDLRAFQPSRFAVSSAATGPAQFETLLEKKTEFGGAVTHIDGHCVVANLDERLAAQGVLFGSLT